MCTAVSFTKGRRFLARNLDHTEDFSCGIAVIPRGYRHPCEIIPHFESKYAIVGIASVIDGEPLLFDGMNERGIAVAGLNLPYSTSLAKNDRLPKPNRPSEDLSSTAAFDSRKEIFVPAFDLMRRILAAAQSIPEVKELLSGVTLTDEPPRLGVPSPTLHYLVSDGRSSLTVEQTEGTLRVYDNPVGILTNEPPFPYQLSRLEEILNLCASSPQPKKLCDLTVSPKTHGLGAIGLPGDFSSPSRFLRTAFIKEHLPTYNDITATRVAIFELLGAVSIPDGAVDTGGGKFMRTRYSSIMDQSDLTYLVRTPECSHTRTLTLTDSLASSPKPLFYPLKGCDSISDVSGSLAFT